MITELHGLNTPHGGLLIDEPLHKRFGIEQIKKIILIALGSGVAIAALSLLAK